MEQKIVYVGADHAGYDMKKVLKEHVSGLGFKIVDLGSFTEDAVDYPDIAREVAEKVTENKSSLGLLVCGTGIGMDIAANRLPGVRAATCTDENMANLSRRHNDANILCLGGRITTIEKAKNIATAFFTTEFENSERHVRRVKKMG